MRLIVLLREDWREDPY
ncbi:hypothetical protein ACROYT_G003155 [Oculina patagonica]